MQETVEEVCQAEQGVCPIEEDAVSLVGALLLGPHDVYGDVLPVPESSPVEDVGRSGLVLLLPHHLLFLVSLYMNRSSLYETMYEAGCMTLAA